MGNLLPFSKDKKFNVIQDIFLSKFIKLSVSAKHEYGMDSRSEKDPWTPNSFRGNRPPVPVNVSPLFIIKEVVCLFDWLREIWGKVFGIDRWNWRKN